MIYAQIWYYVCRRVWLVWLGFLCCLAQVRAVSVCVCACEHFYMYLCAAVSVYALTAFCPKWGFKFVSNVCLLSTTYRSRYNTYWLIRISCIIVGTCTSASRPAGTGLPHAVLGEEPALVLGLCTERRKRRLLWKCRLNTWMHHRRASRCNECRATLLIVCVRKDVGVLSLLHLLSFSHYHRWCLSVDLSGSLVWHSAFIRLRTFTLVPQP